MDAYDLSGEILDAWRQIAIPTMNSGQINKSCPAIHTCVIMDDNGKRKVIGCHIEGTEIILDLEGN